MRLFIEIEQIIEIEEENFYQGFVLSNIRT